jgi:hypothetical protein
VAKIKLLIKTEILGVSYKKGDIVDVGGVYADKLVNHNVATLDLGQSEVKPQEKVEENESQSS